MSRTLYFKGVPVTFDDAGFAGPWFYGESDVRVCTCASPDVQQKPSGMAFCGRCGGVMAVQPPPTKERP